MEAVAHNPMPDEFETQTKQFTIGDVNFYATAGASEDRCTGYLSINGIKLGPNLRGAMRAWADTFTAAWQHSTPLRLLIDINAHTRFEPCGPTGDPDLGFASSPFDPVVRWLDIAFLGAPRRSLPPTEDGASLPPPSGVTTEDRL